MNCLLCVNKYGVGKVIVVGGGVVEMKVEMEGHCLYTGACPTSAGRAVNAVFGHGRGMPPSLSLYLWFLPSARATIVAPTHRVCFDFRTTKAAGAVADNVIGGARHAVTGILVFYILPALSVPFFLKPDSYGLAAQKA